MFIEINLRKTKWLMLRALHPPNQTDNCFFKSIGTALDQYQKFLLLGDFNAEDTEHSLSEFLKQCAAKNIMKEKRSLKIPSMSTCIDLFLTNYTNRFVYRTVWFSKNDYYSIKILIY